MFNAQICWAELVTIISKTLAEQLSPNAEAGEAIGRRLILGNDEKTTQTLNVVGISGDFPTRKCGSANISDFRRSFG
jgi:hypothetical protein